MDLQKLVDNLDTHFYEDMVFSTDVGVNKQDVLELLKQVRNQTIDECIENAEIKTEKATFVEGTFDEITLDKQSLLKLKIE